MSDAEYVDTLEREAEEAKARIQELLETTNRYLEERRAIQQRMQAEIDRLNLRLGRTRMCVNCGRTADARLSRRDASEGCKTKAACEFDMTPEEAMLYWKNLYHELWNMIPKKVAEGGL